MESGNKSNSVSVAGGKVSINIKREVFSKVRSSSASSTGTANAAAVKTSTCAAAVSSTVKDTKPAKDRARNAAKASSSPSSSSSSTSFSSSLAGRTSAASKVCQLKDEACASSSSTAAAAPASIAAATSSSSAGSAQADQSFTAADSNSNIPTKLPIPCKVCGDKASGYHYGVTSCEGCKGFFRRSIQKQIEYRCLRDSKCVIIRLNRNRCQFCRFRKCIAVGMSRDSVRYGRVPKRPKEKIEERVTQAEADQSEKESDTKPFDIIRTINAAHLNNCYFTEERMRGLVKKPADFTLEEVDMSEDTVHSFNQQRLIMWERFAYYAADSVAPIVEFAKKTPGFSELIQDDQLILIKSGFFEIWLVHISRTIDPMANTLTFLDGSYVSTQQLDLVFDHDFVSSIFAFGIALNNFRLTDTEIGIFSALVLLCTDRANLTNTKFIRQQHEKIREAFRLEFNNQRPRDVHLLPNILEKLPELRTLGSRHNEHLRWFRNRSSRAKLPGLFAEICDIPDYQQIR